ncbi:MAG: hypothetical protein NT051_06545, partial [Candidatus Micrarchaeota archaeon]|nr:hypothetical protein [Candidatus Micrarchaeota archaeon]
SKQIYVEVKGRNTETRDTVPPYLDFHSSILRLGKKVINFWVYLVIYPKKGNAKLIRIKPDVVLSNLETKNFFRLSGKAIREASRNRNG